MKHMTIKYKAVEYECWRTPKKTVTHHPEIQILRTQKEGFRNIRWREVKKNIYTGHMYQVLSYLEPTERVLQNTMTTLHTASYNI